MKYNCHSNLPGSLWGGLFEGFTLFYLEIYDCLLTSIASNALTGLPRLLSLVIQTEYKSHQREICSQTRSVENVEEAIASETVCSQEYLWFPKEIFSENKHLVHLEMNGVRLNNSIWAAIRDLKTLTHLSLRDNYITVLRKDSIDKLTRMTILGLSINGLEGIFNGTFKSQTNLKLLNLSLNNINTVEKDALDGLLRLEILNLASNKITTIYSRMFESLRNLKELDLSNNGIELIEQGAF